ncbi:hypothetical protein R84B8_01212 [Treponema sp. R8-4-B8]
MNCDPANPKGTGIVDVWQESAPVRFGAIDKSDRLTLDAVFNFFQEAAICHAENLGVGREDMARTGQVWIIHQHLTRFFWKQAPCRVHQSFNFIVKFIHTGDDKTLIYIIDRFSEKRKN